MNNVPSLQTLTALNEAALAIAEGLSLPRTLQRIADTSRALLKVKYAALGVFREDRRELEQFITSGIEPQRVRHIGHEPVGVGLLGAIVDERRPIRLERLADDPRSSGFCKGHPIMTSFLGVPITNRGKALGNLYLCDREDGLPFDEQDEQMVELLAAHAAIAIENGRLHEELQKTALRGERDRIGMELHDGVIQSIYAVGMKLEILQSKLETSEEQDAQFNTLKQDLNHIIEDVRAYINNLISAHDEQVALRQRIKNLGMHFRDFSGIAVVVDVTEEIPVLSDYQRHNLLQMLRELLANIARHAGASEARVSLTADPRSVTLTVSDNGHGFMKTLDEATAAENHFGLRNVEQRARHLGGQFEVETAAGQGTTVIITFPAMIT